jgi:hypothetical protein
MMQPKPKKQVGEMGYPSQEKEFNAAMQKEWMSRKPGAPGKPAVKDGVSQLRGRITMTKVMKKSKA